MLYISTKLRSNGVFVVSVIWLVIYIFTITSKYFSQLVGWPVALLLAGFILIGSGYFVVGLKNKYFSKKA